MSISSLIPYLSYLSTFFESWKVFFMPVFFLFGFIYYFEYLPIRAFRLFTYILAGVLLFRAIFRMVLTYAVWSGGPPSSYFLPPYQPLTYFFQYSYTHYFASLILVGIVMVCAGYLACRGESALRSGERIVWNPGEEYIMIAGGLIAGWPLVIVYLVGAIVLATLWGVAIRFIERTGFIDVVPFFFISLGICLLTGDPLIRGLGLLPLMMPL